MSRRTRYPKINLNSKNDLAKRISSDKFTFKQALALINDVLNNHDAYWKDNIKQFKPNDDKYVRTAYGTPLGKLLRLIDRKVLAVHDDLLPEFIFGGVSGRDHVKAASSLLGVKRQRVKLGLDIKKFFENNLESRVSYFFMAKCGCSLKVSKLLARLSCVVAGPKGSLNDKRTLARGFATSTRLATWVNLDLLIRVHWQVKKRLKGHDSRIAIFVDDIGITASRLSEDKLTRLSNEVKNILKDFDKNQTLPLNDRKTNIQHTKNGNVEHLGMQIGRTKIGLGRKATKKKIIIKKQLSVTPAGGTERAKLIKVKKSYINYERYIAKINSTK